MTYNLAVDECDSSPCQNGGTCTDAVNGYGCACVLGYDGTECQTEITPTSAPTTNALTTSSIIPTSTQKNCWSEPYSDYKVYKHKIRTYEGIVDVPECLGKCEANPECIAVDFVTTLGTCKLRSSGAPLKIYTDDPVEGFINVCRYPMPTAFPCFGPRHESTLVVASDTEQIGSKHLWSVEHCMVLCMENDECSAFKFKTDTNKCSLFKPPYALENEPTGATVVSYENLCRPWTTEQPMAESTTTTTTVAVTISTRTTSVKEQLSTIKSTTTGNRCWSDPVNGYGVIDRLITQSNASNIPECLEMCEAHSTCVAADFTETTGKCDLQRSGAPLKLSPGTKSFINSCRYTKPTAFPCFGPRHENTFVVSHNGRYIGAWFMLSLEHCMEFCMQIDKCSALRFRDNRGCHLFESPYTLQNDTTGKIVAYENLCRPWTTQKNMGESTSTPSPPATPTTATTTTTTTAAAAAAVRTTEVSTTTSTASSIKARTRTNFKTQQSTNLPDSIETNNALQSQSTTESSKTSSLYRACFDVGIYGNDIAVLRDVSLEVCRVQCWNRRPQCVGFVRGGGRNCGLKHTIDPVSYLSVTLYIPSSSSSCPFTSSTARFPLSSITLGSTMPSSKTSTTLSTTEPQLQIVTDPTRRSYACLEVKQDIGVLGLELRQIHGISVEECLDECWNNQWWPAECVGFVINNGYCSLKNAIVEMMNIGAVLYIVHMNASSCPLYTTSTRFPLVSSTSGFQANPSSQVPPQAGSSLPSSTIPSSLPSASNSSFIDALQSSPTPDSLLLLPTTKNSPKTTADLFPATACFSETFVGFHTYLRNLSSAEHSGGGLEACMEMCLQQQNDQCAAIAVYESAAGDDSCELKTAITPLVATANGVTYVNKCLLPSSFTNAMGQQEDCYGPRIENVSMHVGDLKRFDVLDEGQCGSLCDDYPGCLAVVYDTTIRRCYLKPVANRIVRADSKYSLRTNLCRYSPQGCFPYIPLFQTDSPGGDLGGVSPFLTGTNVDTCGAACASNPTCLGFAFAYLSGDACYLKLSLVDPSAYVTRNGFNLYIRNLTALCWQQPSTTPMIPPPVCYESLGFVNFVGNDIDDGLIEDKTLTECQDLCTEIAHCALIGYYSGAKHCYLKHAAVDGTSSNEPLIVSYRKSHDCHQTTSKSTNNAVNDDMTSTTFPSAVGSSLALSMSTENIINTTERIGENIPFSASHMSHTSFTTDLSTMRPSSFDPSSSSSKPSLSVTKRRMSPSTMMASTTTTTTVIPASTKTTLIPSLRTSPTATTAPALSVIKTTSEAFPLASSTLKTTENPGSTTTVTAIGSLESTAKSTIIPPNESKTSKMMLTTLKKTTENALPTILKTTVTAISSLECTAKSTTTIPLGESTSKLKQTTEAYSTKTITETDASDIITTTIPKRITATANDTSTRTSRQSSMYISMTTQMHDPRTSKIVREATSRGISQKSTTTQMKPILDTSSTTKPNSSQPAPKRVFIKTTKEVSNQDTSASTEQWDDLVGTTVTTTFESTSDESETLKTTNERLTVDGFAAITKQLNKFTSTGDFSLTPIEPSTLTKTLSGESTTVDQGSESTKAAFSSTIVDKQTSFVESTTAPLTSSPTGEWGRLERTIKKNGESLKGTTRTTLEQKLTTTVAVNVTHRSTLTMEKMKQTKPIAQYSSSSKEPTTIASKADTANRSPPSPFSKTTSSTFNIHLESRNSAPPEHIQPPLTAVHPSVSTGSISKKTSSGGSSTTLPTIESRIHVPVMHQISAETKGFSKTSKTLGNNNLISSSRSSSEVSRQEGLGNMPKTIEPFNDADSLLSLEYSQKPITDYYLPESATVTSDRNTTETITRTRLPTRRFEEDLGIDQSSSATADTAMLNEEIVVETDSSSIIATTLLHTESRKDTDIVQTLDTVSETGLVVTAGQIKANSTGKHSFDVTEKLESQDIVIGSYEKPIAWNQPVTTTASVDPKPTIELSVITGTETERQDDTLQKVTVQKNIVTGTEETAVSKEKTGFPSETVLSEKRSSTEATRQLSKTEIAIKVVGQLLGGLADENIPEEIMQAIVDGNPVPVTDYLKANQLVPSDEKIDQIMDDNWSSSDHQPSDFLQTMNQWQKQQVTLGEKREIEKILDVPGGGIPPGVMEAVEGGEPRALIEWMSDQGVRPESAEWTALRDTKEFQSIPPRLRGLLNEYAARHIPEDGLEVLERFAVRGKDDKTKSVLIPPEMVKELDDRNVGAFTDWLDERKRFPTDEEIADLKSAATGVGTADPILPADIIVAIETWNDNRKLNPMGRSELERFAGMAQGALPQRIVDAVNRGNYTAFTSWLRRNNVRTSRNQYNRLKNGERLFNIPANLITEIDRFYDEHWLLGAWKTLNRFVGSGQRNQSEIPSSVERAVEAGNFGAFTEWMDKQGIDPSIKEMMDLERQHGRFDIPTEFMTAVRQWYKKFSRSHPPMTTTSTAPTTERILAPGETTTPPYPMSETEEQVASVMQTLGCTALLGILAATVAGYLIIVRDPSIERFLHMNQEISLFLAHALIITMRDKTTIHVPCKLVSIALQSSFLTNFVFMAFEAFQAYTIGSNVIPNEGIFNKKQYFVMGWALPFVFSGVSATFFQQHYVSFFSCWLNLGHGVAMVTMIPVMALSGATIVMIEAAGMDTSKYPVMPGSDSNQKTASIANQKGLLFVLPASVASWFVGLYAVYEANIALYGMVFALNLTLAIFIFTFHTLGNPKVHRIMKSILPCL